MKILTEKANKIYDLLIEIGGANPRDSDRADFIHTHCESDYDCSEYRFQGHLGFGGKYWSGSNRVSFYSEDVTADRIEIKEKLNKALKEI